MANIENRYVILISNTRYYIMKNMFKKTIFIIALLGIVMTTLSTNQNNAVLAKKNFMDCTEDQKCWDDPRNLADNNYYPNSKLNHNADNDPDFASYNDDDNNSHQSNDDDNIEIHNHTTHHKNNDIVIYEYSEPIQQEEYYDNVQVFDASDSSNDFSVDNLLSENIISGLEAPLQ